MNGGYFQLYLEIDLSETKKTITGAYQLAKSAIESGKPIILYGATNAGTKITPIQMFGWFDGTSYAFGFTAFEVSIASDDSITVSR